MRAVVDVTLVVALLGAQFVAWPGRWVIVTGGAVWLLMQAIVDETGRRFHLMYLCVALLFLGFMSIYALNPSHQWDGALGLVPVDQVAWLPASVHSGMTWSSLSFATMVAVTAGLGLRLGRASINMLVCGLIATGLWMALLVLEQRWTPNEYQIFPRTGWFTYENHYAAFANLILPLMLAAIACGYGRRKMWRALGIPLLLAGAALLVTSIYYARSRAALAISMWIIVLFAGQQTWRHIRPSAPVNVTRWLVFAPLVVVMLLAGVWGMNHFWGDTSRLTGELGYRGLIVADTLSILRDRPLLGTGPGTFASVFPYYQSATISDRMINQAHCDPVQFLVEYGLLGTALFLGMIAWLACRRPRLARETSGNSSLYELRAPAMAIGLSGLMMHSLVDFPWRNGTLAMMGFCYASIWLGAGLRSEVA